jgi:cell division protein ZapA (FtsZ GTPase activity inhibitor)
MGELSVKVTIAGRTYPLTIKREEEENVRKAAKHINERVKIYEDNYSVRDKQDLLAMCSLQLATEKLLLESKPIPVDNKLAESLAEMESFVSDYLKKD